MIETRKEELDIGKRPAGQMETKRGDLGWLGALICLAALIGAVLLVVFAGWLATAGLYAFIGGLVLFVDATERRGWRCVFEGVGALCVLLAGVVMMGV